MHLRGRSCHSTFTRGVCSLYISAEGVVKAFLTLFMHQRCEFSAIGAAAMLEARLNVLGVHADMQAVIIRDGEIFRFGYCDEGGGGV